MGTKLTHAPVYFVLAQVRFNPVAALDNFAPEIQDQLRLNGYPDQQKKTISTFNLNMASSLQAMTPERQELYTAWNMEQTAGFVLDSKSLSFQTTDYSVYEEFLNAFAVGLRVVHEVIGLAFRESIGIRYLDAVYPFDNDALTQYIQNSVLGMYGKLDGSMRQSFSETTHENDGGLLVSRAITEDGPVRFPPDLQTFELKLAERFGVQKGLHTILDTDASKNERIQFDVEDIIQQLAALKEEVSASFKKTVTPYALEKWK